MRSLRRHLEQIRHHMRRLCAQQLIGMRKTQCNVTTTDNSMKRIFICLFSKSVVVLFYAFANSSCVL